MLSTVMLLVYFGVGTEEGKMDYKNVFWAKNTLIKIKKLC